MHVASRSARLIVGLSCVGLLAAAGGERDPHHHGANEVDEGRVILPSAGPTLTATFASIRHVIPTVNVAIQRTAANGKACKANVCWPFRLTDPERPCSALKSPAFCLTWTGDVPPAVIAAPIAAALGEVDPAKIWRAPPDRPASAYGQIGFALLLLCGPVLVGFLVARAMRFVAPNHPGVRTLIGFSMCVGLGIAGLVWSLKDQAHPSPADCVLSASLLFAGIWAGGLQLTEPRVLKLAIIGSLIGLCGAEFVLRETIPTAPICWHGDEIKLLHPGASDRHCRGAFAGRDEAFFGRAMRRATGRDGHVLHIGDSMVFGSGVAENETFVSHLDRTNPGVSHVNVSTPDTGPDHYLLVLKRWLLVRKPRHVVVYVYTGNDLADLDRPNACCGGASLLRYQGKFAVARCESTRWQPNSALSLLQSAPPYAIQVAARYSHGGAMACAATRPVAAQLGRLAGLLPGSADGGHQVGDHMRAVFETMRDATTSAGSRLSVVVLPEREGLEDRFPNETAARKRATRVAEMAAELGITTHNLWPQLVKVVQHDGPSTWFARTHAKDYHFSRRGHQFIGKWLNERVVSAAGATK